MSQLLIKIECSNLECKNEVTVSSANLHRGKFMDNSGKTIWLTYFDCPECGKRHYVQIDDMHTNAMLEDIKRLSARFAVLKRKDKQVPQKQSDKFKKLRTKLKTMRSKLEKEYNGKALKDSDGICFTLELTVL